jgi:hypothetical protein
LGSVRLSFAGFGVSAEILEILHYFPAEQKVRDGDDAIASTRAACALQNQQSLRMLSFCNPSEDDVAGRLKRKLNFSNFRFGISPLAV